MAETTAEMPNVRVMLQGQSNCWGKGKLSDLDGPFAGLSKMAKTAFERVLIMCPDDTGGWGYQPLRVGVNSQAFCDFGCEFGLAIRWEQETKGGNLYIEKQYIDGAPIRYFLKNGKCDPNSSGCPGPEEGAFFNGLLKQREKTNEWFKNRQMVTDVAWIWVQGEGDFQTSVTDYLKYLEAYTNSLMVSSPALLPNTARMILALQKPDNVSGPSPNPDQAKAEFKDLYRNATRLIAPTDNYLDERPTFGPRTHLNGKGLVLLGYDAFEEIFDASHRTAESP